MTAIKAELLTHDGSSVMHPQTSDKAVLTSDGGTLYEALEDVKTMVGDDVFSPTIIQTQSMAKFGQGDNVDVSDNVVDGYYKSAVLSGNTMVNLMESTPTLSSSHNWVFKLVRPLTKATIFNYNNLEFFVSYYNLDGTWSNIELVSGSVILLEKPNKTINAIQMPSNDENIETFKKGKFVILEEDKTGENIPFFSGIGSVKSPVLTSSTEYFTNLPFSLFKNATYKNYAGWTILELDELLDIEVRAKCLSDINSQGYRIVLMDNQASPTQRSTSFMKTANQISTVSLTNVNRIGFHGKMNDGSLQIQSGLGKEHIINNLLPNILNVNFKVTNKHKPIYPPYNLSGGDKTNILTTLEPVELLSKDSTLNAITGEVYEPKQKLNLNTINSWSINYNVTDFISFISSAITSSNSPILCDKLPTSSTGNNEFVITSSAGRVIVSVAKTKLTGETISAFVQYLQTANINIVVNKITPSFKTVMLDGSPMGYKGGHIQLSSEDELGNAGLVPTLEYSVATSRGGQITQNTQWLTKHDKEINDINELLINGEINTLHRTVLLNYNLGQTQELDVYKSNSKVFENLLKIVEEFDYCHHDILAKTNNFYCFNYISDYEYEFIMSKLHPKEEELF